MASVDFELKNFLLTFDNWPVALVGDGCAANNPAGDGLATNYGLLSLTTCCSAHVASCSIWLLEDGLLQNNVCGGSCCICKWYSSYSLTFSIKQEDHLPPNDALEMRNMKKLKIMTWCPTQMANLLDTCATIVGLLFLLCDALANCNVMQEERAYFMSPLCLAILHLLADLQEVMISYYLRRLDTDDSVKKVCT